MFLTYLQYSPFWKFCSSENIAASEEQGFSTNVQVGNDITSGYTEGSHGVF